MAHLAYRKKGSRYVLPKRLRQHAQEFGLRSIEALKRTLHKQNEDEKRSGLVSCWECKEIARKFGIDPKEA